MFSNQLTKMINTGWTEEDIKIWRHRKMPAHTIRYRKQTHDKEARLMLQLSRINLNPGIGKIVAIRLLGYTI